MRRILSVLYTKTATSLFQTPRYGNGVLNFPLYKFGNQINSAPFSSFIPRSINVNTPLGYFGNYNKFLGQNSSEQIRTLTKFSWKKGKRKSVRAVKYRFFRLHWGIWIRTIAGRFKKLWKKNLRQRNRYKQHVFCNATQTKLLDTMVSKSWKKPKYYIEDPYEVYHKRENFYITRRKPWRPDGVDYE